jgi:excisionase family DNA binding protein
MTTRRLPIKATLARFDRRGGGLGEPVPHPVPPSIAPEAALLLDSREVARLLGISRTKTFTMMARQELPTVRIGRCVRVSRAALVSWIGDQVVEPAPEVRAQSGGCSR